MSDNKPSFDHGDELVDEAGRESFPASDPPSFSPGVADAPVQWSKPAQPIAASSISHDAPYHASISRHQLKPSSALRQCCDPRSMAPWALFAAATVTGVVVGGLLARSHVTRH